MKPLIESDGEPLRHSFRQQMSELADRPEPRFGDVAFFFISFVSWFIIIFGLIA